MMTPFDYARIVRDQDAGFIANDNRPDWIDEDTAYRNAIFDLIGEWLPWAVCFIVMGLIGLWLACGHS